MEQIEPLFVEAGVEMSNEIKKAIIDGHWTKADFIGLKSMNEVSHWFEGVPRAHMSRIWNVIMFQNKGKKRSRSESDDETAAQEKIKILMKDLNERKMAKALGTKSATISCAQIMIDRLKEDPLIIESSTSTTVIQLPNEYKEKTLVELFGETKMASLLKLRKMWDEWKDYGVPEEEKPEPFKKQTESTGQKPTKKAKLNEQLAETIHQHPFFRDIIKEINTSENVLKHEKPVFKNRQHADFAFIGAEKPVVANFCLFVVELQLNEIDNTHLGQVLMYNELVLDANPKRSFIVSVVTNLNQMILFRTARSMETMSKIKISIPLNFWIDGLRYLKYMLDNPEAVGYDLSFDFNFKLPLDPCSYYPSKFIGKGNSAHVFRFQKLDQNRVNFDKCSDFVIKIFDKEIQYNKEKKIFNELTERNVNSKYFVNMVTCNDQQKAIVLKPLGRPLKKERLTKSHVGQMFACVKELHMHGVIHRDLCPSHFFINDSELDGQVFLIDLGSAIFIDDSNKSKLSELKNRYEGSLQYAAKDILDGLIKGEEYIPHRRHDLESLVKTILCLHHQVILPEFPWTANQKEAIDKTRKWWEYIEDKLKARDSNGNLTSGAFWVDALEIVRNPNSTTTFEDIEAHINNRLIIFDLNFSVNDFEKKN